MKTLVVTDTSPLIALERLGRLDLLPALYDVLAPEAVAREFGSYPNWLRVVRISNRARRDALLSVLDLGEAEAITLAEEIARCSLLIDEARGRRVAQRLGLDVVGTLGVLVRAKRAGQLALVAPLIEELRSTHGFHVADAVVASALQEAGEA